MDKHMQNIIPFESTIDTTIRESVYGHKSAVLWFTGLSGSGKSTLSHGVEVALLERGIHVYVLDGDNMRKRLCRDLGFSAADRQENIRRIGEVSALFADAGMIVLSAFISPYRSDRDKARKMVSEGKFVEIYVKASVELCEKRDPKGLYKKARAGEITDFTGISAPYEEPENPEIVIDTQNQSPEEAVEQIVDYLTTQGIIS